MLNGLDGNATRFLNDLARIQQRLTRAQREISSGLRITSASDDPDRISTLLQLRADLGQTEQVKSNLGRVQGEVDAAEASLRQAVSLLERATVLGTQGANGTHNAQSRANIAREVAAILEQMVALAGTAVEGRYIFSGDSDQVLPYTLDWAQADPVSSYAGAASTRQALDAGGRLFPIAQSAEEIFDNADPQKNVFDALLALHTALVNNDEPAIKAALAGLNSAAEHLESKLAFYGTAQNQVAAALDAANQQEIRLKARISGIQDADLTEAILEMQQATVQQEAALASRAKLPRTSLFDYLG